MVTNFKVQLTSIRTISVNNHDIKLQEKHTNKIISEAHFRRKDCYK